MSQYHPIVFFLQLGVLISLGLAGYCADRLRQNGRSLITLCVGLLAVFTAIYNGAAAMKTASLALPTKLWWYKLEFLGSAVLPSVAVVLAVAYLGRRRWLTRPVLGVLVGVPAVVVPLIIANPGSVMITEPALVEINGLQVLEHGFPPLFVLSIAWGEGVFLLAALLVGTKGLFGKLRRTPALILSAALALPPAAALLKTLEVYPPGGDGVNLASVFATGMLVLVALAIARYRVLGLLPVGRSQALEVMSDGCVLVDAAGTIVDANGSARALLGEEHLVSRAVGAVVPELGISGGMNNSEQETGSIIISAEGQVLQVRSSPIRDGAKVIGRVFTLRDITPLREREQALKEENERLDRFASILSHDLRTPLNVALGRAQLAKEAGHDDPDDHLSSMGRALERMDEIIEDMLLLTWSRRDVRPEDLETVEFKKAARRAWDSVDTPGATLEIGTSAKLRCHEGRLRRLLENLFRNAIEHGRMAVTVTTGSLLDKTPPGFFVEDDGPGIPSEQRESVLEDGYSSREAGTGLGLSIVQEIAEAHGWALSIAEGRKGGARFEFRVASADGQ